MSSQRNHFTKLVESVKFMESSVRMQMQDMARLSVQLEDLENRLAELALMNSQGQIDDQILTTMIRK